MWGTLGCIHGWNTSPASEVGDSLSKVGRLPAAGPNTGGGFFVSCVSGKAYRDAMPGFIKPQLATLKRRLPRARTGFTKSNTTATGSSCMSNGDARENLHPQRPRLDEAVLRIAGAFKLPVARPSSTARSLSSMKAGPTSPSCKPTSQKAGRIVCCSMPSISSSYNGEDLRKTSQLTRKELLKELIRPCSIRPSSTASTMKATGRSCSRPPHG